MRTYTAYVTDKNSKQSYFVTADYSNKKAFAEDLRRNGYAVHYIATPYTIDAVSDSYNKRREYRNEVARNTRAAAKAHSEATTEKPAAEELTTEETTVNQEVETMNETTTTAAVKATTTSILSIWYGNLEAYNNGALRGQWIDFEEMDRDEIEEVMNKISRNGRDECMIFDYESRCGIDVGEYASIEELFEIYEICENIIDQYGDECGEYAIKTFCDYYGAKYLTDIEHYDFYFYSECYTMTDVAYEVVDQCGYLDEMPENLRGYFDYEKFGRDLDIEGHFNYCGGGVYCEMVG